MTRTHSAMNDERVRIAHGTWTLGGGARHVPRGTLKAQFHFEKPKKIVEKTVEVKKLMAGVVGLVGCVTPLPETP